MANTPKQDGQIDFSGGQDASQVPSRVGASQYYSAVNTSAAQGCLNPRWGVQEKLVKFDFNSEFTLPTGLTRSFESIFLYGRYQGLIPYTVGTERYLIIIIAGIIFAFNQRTYVVTQIPIAGGTYLNENRPRVNWTNAGKYIVIFDFPSYAVVIEGLTAKRANPATLQLPVSNIGVYAQSRVFFANAGNEYSASDPAAYGFVDGPISCTELLTPASAFYGQVFQLPTEDANSPITAMGYLEQVDTQTGIGPVIISTQDKVFSLQAQLARSQWEVNKFATVFISDAGIIGQRAFCNINSDIYFVDRSGQIRSASMSRENQTKWSKTPVSREIKNFIKLHHPELLEYSVVAYFQNKILITVNPYYVKTTNTENEPILDVAFGGFVVIELDNISTLGKDSNPAWAGLWCPFRPMDFVTNNKEMFAIAKDGGRNTLYKIRPDLSYDIIGVDQRVRKIKSKVYTKEFAFENPFSFKTLNALDFNLQDVRGEFKLHVKYRPSHIQRFLEWRKFEHAAPWRVCNGLPIGCQWNGFAPQSFRDLDFGSPVEAGESPINNDSGDTVRKVQLLFEIEGVDWQIESFIVTALELPMNTTEVTYEKAAPVEICVECDNVWEIPILCQENQEL